MPMRQHVGMRSGQAVHGWRKLAGASWSAPCDPQFYGDLEIDAATLLAYIGDLRRRSGQHVTVTHAVVKAVAQGLREVPELNARLARGRARARDSVDVLVIVALGDDDLTGIKLCDVDHKSLVDIAHELEERIGRIRSGDDAEFGRTKTLLNRLPSPLLRVGLRAVSVVDQRSEPEPATTWAAAPGIWLGDGQFRRRYWNRARILTVGGVLPRAAACPCRRDPREGGCRCRLSCRATDPHPDRDRGPSLSRRRPGGPLRRCGAELSARSGDLRATHDRHGAGLGKLTLCVLNAPATD
jgi:hypothetical protein